MFYGIIFIDNKEGDKMIQIFDIKKEKSLKMNDSEMLKKYIDESILNNEELMKKYNVKRCYYGHLHGNSIYDAVEGKIQGIELKLVSADGLDFKLIKI